MYVILAAACRQAASSDCRCEKMPHRIQAKDLYVTSGSENDTVSPVSPSSRADVELRGFNAEKPVGYGSIPGDKHSVDEEVPSLAQFHPENHSAAELQPSRAEDGHRILQAAVTLASSCLGAGVLSFPYCFRTSGLVVGLSLCLGFGSFLAGSCWVVGFCCHKAQAKDPSVRTYHALVELAGGPRLAALVEVVMWLYLFGISLSFCIIIGDIAQPLLSQALGDSSFLSNRSIAVAVIIAAIVFPLCMIRDISQLGVSSFLAVAAVLYVVVLVAGYNFTHEIDWSRIQMVNDAESAFTSMPIIGFGLGCHIQAPIIFSELPQQDRMTSFSWVVLAAFSLCIALYTLCGVAGYLTFGPDTPQNILNKEGDVGYPTDDISFIVAKVCVLLVSVCGLPLNHYPARQAMWSLVCRCCCPTQKKESFHIIEVDSNIGKTPPEEMPLLFVVVETLLFVGLVYSTSLCLTELATAFDLFGAICGSLEILIVPGLLWWHFASSQSQLCRLGIAFCFCVVGVLIMISGTYVSIQQMM